MGEKNVLLRSDQTGWAALLTQNDNWREANTTAAVISYQRKMRDRQGNRLPLCLQHVTLPTRLLMQAATIERCLSMRCVRVRLVFDAVGRSRYLRRFKRGVRV